MQVRVPEFADVRGKEGGDDAERLHSVQLVVPEDLSVDEHGTDGAARLFGERGERAEEDLRRPVAVAVRQQLRAPVRGKAAGVAHLGGGHRLRAVPAARIRLAQQRRFFLRGAVQEDLHAADIQRPARRRPRARLRGKTGARLVEIFGRGIGGDVEAERWQELFVQGEHFAGEQPLLRRRHAVGKVNVLRTAKDRPQSLALGQRDAARRGKELALFEDVGAQAQEPPRRLVAQPRVSRARLDEQRARAVHDGDVLGQKGGVFQDDELACAKPLSAREAFGAAQEVLRRTAGGGIRLRQGERIGKQMRVRVGEGGQHARPAERARPVIGRQRRDEEAVLRAEGGLGREGHCAVRI